MKQLKSTFLIAVLLTLSFVSATVLAKSPIQNPVIVNINKADISALQLLKGIGKIKAKSILTYRKKNGAFKAVNDLNLIKGISKKTIAKNINNISLTKGLTTAPAKAKRAKRKVKPKKEQVKTVSKKTMSKKPVSKKPINKKTTSKITTSKKTS